jgi:hypothetical protein
MSLIERPTAVRNPFAFFEIDFIKGSQPDTETIIAQWYAPEVTRTPEEPGTCTVQLIVRMTDILTPVKRLGGLIGFEAAAFQ